MSSVVRSLAFLALAIPATTLGQAQLEIQLNLPDRLPLVTIQPGVQVARDLDEEVFFVSGRYWVRRDERWYGARAPGGPWAYVEPRRAPPALTRMPPGLFRHWQGRPTSLPDTLPPLVTIRPGVQVVRDLDEEVFYANGYYWVRREGHWFRSRDHRGNWAYVEPGRAPPQLVQFPPGLFRRWQGRPANLPDRLPPLVTIRPGVQVVRDLDEEVFYAGNYYWVRREGHWFRSRDHRRGWAYVEPGRAPPELVESPPGHYRHWRENEAEQPGRGGEGEQGRHGQDRGQR